MLYREAGQFKTSYAADQSIFPILQDKIGMILLIAFLFVAVPLLFPGDTNSYLYEVILLPVLVFALATIGLNVLTGYAGQISLGTGAFMAVGAYSTFKIVTYFPDLNIVIVFLISGVFAAVAGVLFGLPSLRIKGFYLAVATLAAQFFFEWLFQSVGWFTNNLTSRTIGLGPKTLFGYQVAGPGASSEAKYLLALTFLVVFALLVKNLVRGRVGRSWMAIRDMDIAAEIIGIRPLRTKLLAFAVSSYICGVAGSLYAFILRENVEMEAFELLAVSFPVLFMVIIGGLGSISGSIMGAIFIIVIPVIMKEAPDELGLQIASHTIQHIQIMVFGAAIVFFLIVEPHGLARLWQIAKEKLRLWPFPH